MLPAILVALVLRVSVSPPPTPSCRVASTIWDVQTRLEYRRQNLNAGPSSPRELLTALMYADNTSDLEGVVALYAENAVLLPPNEPVVQGRNAIRARYRGIFAATRMQVRFEIDDEHVERTLATVRGRTIGRRVSTDGARVDDLTGKFVMVLKSDGSGWTISTLIWNADGPAK